MTVLSIFEKVNLICPLDQRNFFHSFNASVSELDAMYGDVNKLVLKGDFNPVYSLDAENMVLPLYHDAIVDNILFLAGQGADYKTEFLRKAENAFLQYWNKNAKGRAVKRKRW